MDNKPGTTDKSQIMFLVVDDLANMRRTIKNMLRQLGYARITEAENGLDAWRKLPIENIDVAIVDWNMPQMSGVELLRRIRADEKFAQIPIIMVTAENEADSIAEAAEAGCSAYIIKPLVVKVLAEKITAALGKKEKILPLDALLSLAKVLADAGQFNKAVDHLKSAMIMSPSSPSVYLAFGDLFMQRGMMDDAEKAYQKAVIVEPQFTLAYDRLADLYARKGEMRKSIEALLGAVSKSPRNAARQTKLGKAQLEQGMVREAKAAFENAIKLEPDNKALQSAVMESLQAKNALDGV